MANEREIAGVVGFYKDAKSILGAMPKVRDANYENFDSFTPYPIHGMDDAMGLKRSTLPYVTFTFGVIGFTCAILFQWWTSAVDWPLIVGGKPFYSWPAFVPVMFELTVLFAGISTFVSMILYCRLPNERKAFDPAITCDRFAIYIGPGKTSGRRFKKFDEAEVKKFLQGIGATDVKVVYEEGWF